jgi:hypothetical protein
MRFRTHLLSSLAAGVALYRRDWKKLALITIAGTLIDVDHFVLYAMRSGDWNPLGAVKYDKRRHKPIRRGDTKPRYGSLRSLAHRPWFTLPLTWLLAWRWPAVQPVAVGLSLHLALDAPFPSLDWRVWRRARGHCERCGVTGLVRGVYYVRTPSRGGSRWDLANRAAWCERCAREQRRTNWD